MNASKRIFLIDDEPNTLKVLSAFLTKEGYAVGTAVDGQSGLEELQGGSWDMLITDLKLPDKSGLEILETVKATWPNLPVVMITAYGSISNAVQAMKLGAFNYLTKPVDPDELLLLVQKVFERSQLLEENQSMRRQLRDRFSLGNMVGKSKPMQELFNLIEKVSQYEANVLVGGETGTGKELVARGIHYAGQNANLPFVPIDCAAVPETLLESELFGHSRGAFTGATEHKKGQIEMAHGGTLFLDEIGELPLSLQKKFLRFLQEKEIVRLGETRRRKVDVRIIAATNRDLEAEVAKGNWREDLFYRLNVISMDVPALRERKEDIPHLVNHFLAKYNAQNGKAIQGTTGEVMEVFMAYDWPGNVRELENVIERAVVLCMGDSVALSCLPPKFQERRAPNPPAEGVNLIEMEKQLVLQALEKTEYNQSAAARELGISRKQLRTKMKHHGLL
ncbi:MAG: sigma-54-dependent transcriptional regulator [Thermodesulfobacteriota bacterium]